MAQCVLTRATIVAHQWNGVKGRCVTVGITWCMTRIVSTQAMAIVPKSRAASVVMVASRHPMHMVMILRNATIGAMIAVHLMNGMKNNHAVTDTIRCRITTASTHPMSIVQVSKLVSVVLGASRLSTLSPCTITPNVPIGITIAVRRIHGARSNGVMMGTTSCRIPNACIQTIAIVQKSEMVPAAMVASRLTVDMTAQNVPTGATIAVDPNYGARTNLAEMVTFQ